MTNGERERKRTMNYTTHRRKTYRLMETTEKGKEKEEAHFANHREPLIT